MTHGVVLGMTGSGKTGLCLALLEEAAMDRIPAVGVAARGVGFVHDHEIP